MSVVVGSDDERRGAGPRNLKFEVGAPVASTGLVAWLRRRTAVCYDHGSGYRPSVLQSIVQTQIDRADMRREMAVMREESQQIQEIVNARFVAEMASVGEYSDSELNLHAYLDDNHDCRSEFRREVYLSQPDDGYCYKNLFCPCLRDRVAASLGPNVDGPLLLKVFVKGMACGYAQRQFSPELSDVDGRLHLQWSDAEDWSMRASVLLMHRLSRVDTVGGYGPGAGFVDISSIYFWAGFPGFAYAMLFPVHMRILAVRTLGPSPQFAAVYQYWLANGCVLGEDAACCDVTICRGELAVVLMPASDELVNKWLGMLRPGGDEMLPPWFRQARRCTFGAAALRQVYGTSDGLMSLSALHAAIARRHDDDVVAADIDMAWDSCDHERCVRCVAKAMVYEDIHVTAEQVVARIGTDRPPFSHNHVVTPPEVTRREQGDHASSEATIQGGAQPSTVVEPGVLTLLAESARRDEGTHAADVVVGELDATDSEVAHGGIFPVVGVACVPQVDFRNLSYCGSVTGYGELGSPMKPVVHKGFGENVKIGVRQGNWISGDHTYSDGVVCCSGTTPRRHSVALWMMLVCAMLKLKCVDATGSSVWRGHGHFHAHGASTASASLISDVARVSDVADDREVVSDAEVMDVTVSNGYSRGNVLNRGWACYVM